MTIEINLPLGMVVAFAVTLLLSLLLVPLGRRIGLVDWPGARKNHCTPTPMVGGVAMLVAFALGAAAAGVGGLRLEEFWPVLTGAALLVVLGVIDDLHDVDYRQRLVVQTVAAALLVIGGDVRIESLGNLLGFGVVELGLFSVPFSIFAVVGMVNAINMIDGLDGLAGSVSLVITGAVAVLAAVAGSPLVAPAAILAAAVLGFLVLNYRFPWRRRAPIFMGDAGSYFLGYAIAWLVIALPVDAPVSVAPIHMLWVVGFPITDTVTIMWRRRRQGLSMFHAGHDHGHHLLRSAGFGVNATVLILVLITCAYALVGVDAALNPGLPAPVLSYLFVAALMLYYLLCNRIVPLIRPIRRYLADKEMAAPGDA